MTIDMVTLGVMANRLDGITREMTNTMVRAARSTTMAARDFSCSVTGPGHELLSCPEGVPVHVFGSTMLAEAMVRIHPDAKEGDAYLSNDPYDGNSHAADHTILVPVFFEGEHMFTALSKAHQVDCGNALPTTYMPTALDVYNEGALIFPCVRVQERYRDNEDILRMCERRIRAFDTWHGDFLAALGAARLAERRLKEFCAGFGVDEVKQFVEQYLDYSERMAADAIAELPSGSVHAATCLDPFPRMPDGIPLQATIDVDPVAGRIVVDLRDNPDCTPTGLNLTESTSRNAATSGVLTALNSRRGGERLHVPNNSGAFRRIEVLVRENCVVGIPRHPASASVATNTVADRVMGMIMAGMAGTGDGAGLGEPCYGSPPMQGVASGRDARRGGADYIFQAFSGSAGGPAAPDVDGWLTYLLAAGGGIVYVDSTEVVEQKYPVVVWEKVIRMDSEGAGRTRGAPGGVTVYGPRFDAMTCHYFLDGVVNRPVGVRGGGSPLAPEAWRVGVDGTWHNHPEGVGQMEIETGECVVSLSGGGGGYAPPIERDPAAVLVDVADGYVSPERAECVYGVMLDGDPARWETLRVNGDATRSRRAALADCGPLSTEVDDATRAPQAELDWWLAA